MVDTPDMDNPFADNPDLGLTDLGLTDLGRDEDTTDMFGGLPTKADKGPDILPPSVAYQVLARKYRPRTFEDLIGQDAMVRTLTNAFAFNRIAHAFMLTGVRGVGKTTTARLLARALNFETDTVHQPSVDLTVMGRHCQAIVDGRHIDVLELDAASRTGVEAMRDLLESVRYGPVEARYKVYVIDEVHMLSIAAFNALLKTLEEPPPHAKFIFATTEIRKVPVTILSRCQRFDLRRVEPEILIPYLEKVATLEGVKVEAEALAFIARAAEGSVRDGLSLLDQALVQADDQEAVSALVVRDMLGLADRGATLDLFEAIVSGKLTEALQGFRTLYGYGADPSQIMLDQLEYAHACSVAKLLGPEATRLPREPSMRVTALGHELSAGTLSRLWSLMLKALDEIRRAPDPAAAMEMAIIRFCYVADLPGPEALLKRLQKGEDIGRDLGGRDLGGRDLGGGVFGGEASAVVSGATSGSGGAIARAHKFAPEAAPDALPVLNSFSEVLALIDAKRDVSLRMDVERFVKLIAFKTGAITFEPAANMPPDLVRKLSQRLKDWTGRPWMIVTQGGGGAQTLYALEQQTKILARAAAETDPFVVALGDAFPGAHITAIRQKPKPVFTQSATGTDDEFSPKDDD
jgi:DNA polymerase III subunit gamma/tau